MITLHPVARSQKLVHIRAFTLIETLVAVAILSIAVVAPMALVTQSLTTSFYSRDQVTAFFLAQEGIESVRNIRDHNVLLTAFSTPTDLLTGIPVSNTPFVIDARNNAITTCSGPCPQIKIKNDSSLFGHGDSGNPYDMAEPGWQPTRFTRSIQARYVKNPDNTDNLDEIIVTVVVSWRSGSLPVRSFTLSENLYRWIDTTI